MFHEAAPAKLNLFVQVTGRRPDGYHLLDSLVVFANVGDALEAAPAEALTLAVAGPEAAALAEEPDNLVLRAARALAAAAGMPAQAALRLEKRLPVASGIGGGSADAAAALRLLARLWGVPLPPARLAALALAIGADVPVCLDCAPRRMMGIGEILKAPPILPRFGLVLANPRVEVSTPAVFRALAGQGSGPAALPEGWPDAAAMAAGLGRLANDLERPAIALCPAVAEVLAALRALPGALLARMSGSGATCFAILPDAEAAARAASLLPASWWRWGGGYHAAPPR